LTKEYFDVMDPFVTLSAAAAATKRLKLGTAVGGGRRRRAPRNSSSKGIEASADQHYQLEIIDIGDHCGLPRDQRLLEIALALRDFLDDGDGAM
jgi:hypothetical protein